MKPIFGNLNEKCLKIQDILIYVAIRSFIKPSGKCYPSHKEISEIAGCSVKIVRNAIKRLQSAQFLKVFEVHKSKHKLAYTFNNDLLFQQIPDNILFADDLSVKEKAVLLIINEHNENGFVGVGLDIAEKADLPIKTFKKCYEKLIALDYIYEELDFCDIHNVFVPFIQYSFRGIYFGSGEISDFENSIRSIKKNTAEESILTS